MGLLRNLTKFQKKLKNFKKVLKKVLTKGLECGILILHLK